MLYIWEAGRSGEVDMAALNSLRNRFGFVNHGWGTTARAHVRTPFPYLENDWADCFEIILYLVAELPLLHIRYTRHGSGWGRSGHAYVRTFFHSSETAGRILLEFGT